MAEGSKTKLYHTYAGEPPFECSTGDMTGDGLEIVVDKRTHELVIPEGRETEEAVTVIVSPKGEPAAVTPPPAESVSPRPGTRMLDLPPAPGDPVRQAGESIEGLKREHPPRVPKSKQRKARG